MLLSKWNATSWSQWVSNTMPPSSGYPLFILAALRNWNRADTITGQQVLSRNTYIAVAKGNSPTRLFLLFCCCCCCSYHHQHYYWRQQQPIYRSTIVRSKCTLLGSTPTFYFLHVFVSFQIILLLLFLLLLLLLLLFSAIGLSPGGSSPTPVQTNIKITQNNYKATK